MELKQKSKIWIICLAAAALLLGAGIQIALALHSAARDRAAAGELLQNAVQYAVLASDEAAANAEAMELSRQASFAQKAENARALERLDILLLVNRENPVPEDYETELQDIGNQQRLDVRCADALLQMLEDCRAAGNHPYVCSAYRTQAMQQQLYDNKILRLMIYGESPEEAPELAARSVAVPGTSEHQLGLAVDIIDELYTRLDAGQEDTSTQQWLMENSWRYGFILRYPNGSTDITGIIYEPWHYRYVGEEFAKEIYELDVTLEEYIALRRGR